MIYEQGRVVALEDHWAWVETRQNTACGACSAKAGCGQGVLNSLFSGKRHYIRVDIRSLNQAVHLHDQVELAIAENVMLKGSFWVYVLPLLMMIAGAVAAQQMWPVSGDMVAIGGALAGFLTGLGMVRLHARRHCLDPDYQPILHRVVTAARPLSTIHLSS
jgi:sigma-E factor negative regulatory protein RseC